MQPQALGLGGISSLCVPPVDSAETVSPGFLGSLLQWSKPCICGGGSIQQRLTGKWREKQLWGIMFPVHAQG